MRAIRDLSYRAAPHIVRRKSNKTNTIGLLMVGLSGKHLRSDGYFMPLMDGILSGVAFQKYALTTFTFETWTDVHASLRSNVDGKCDGMLFINPPTVNDIVPALHERGLPLVLVYGNSTIPGINRMLADNVATGRDAVRHLISYGHRRIAYLPGNYDRAGALERLQGYKEALEEAGIPFDPELAPEGTYAGPSGYVRTKALFSKPEVSWPTAIFACNDILAKWSIRALRELGLDVPGDVSIVGVDDIDEAEYFHPPITTVTQYLAQTGFNSVQLLHRLIENEPDVPVEVIIPGTLIARESVAPVKPRQTLQ